MSGILTDWQIQSAITDGTLKVEPFDAKFINPNSLDIRLGNNFKINEVTGKILDVYHQRTFNDRFKELTIEDYENIIIYPQQNILATTLETITLPNNICASLEGKSSMARLYIENHKTGGFIDAGFSGEITLELCSSFKDPVRLYPGMPIGQLVFYEIAPVAIPYGEKNNSKYQNQKGATTSMYYRNHINGEI